MTHPHHLHATAAAWSLHTARQHLTRHAAVEARAIALERMEAADGLRSWSPSNGRATGTHGDPSAGAALHGLAAPRRNMWAQLDEAINDTLRWLVGRLDVPGQRLDLDPLMLLIGAIPDLRPGVAANLTQWLTDADTRIRKPLMLAPDRWPLPGSPECPGCGVRQLYALTAAPGPLWTVVCATGCLCRGDGCGCAMDVLAAGVGHIWAADHPLVSRAVAGAARTTTAA